MTSQRPKDWDPRSDAVQKDQRAAYDEMREQCPVAHSDMMGWSLFQHEDVTRVLHDPDTFSNAVSQHVQIPNGMDPPAHTEYRRIIDPYFLPERMDALEPSCRRIAADLVQSLPTKSRADMISNFARPFAVQVQCAFLGWPPEMHEPLHHWTQKNHAATLAQDRSAMAQIAREFEAYVGEMLKIRRVAGPRASNDVTTSLLKEEVWGRPVRDEEIISILRNWTVGEIGTISAAVGILVHHISEHVQLQHKLRVEPSLLPAAIEEILRIHGPLVANRRITTQPVKIGGQQIGAGERISLMWMAANRDARAFEDPEEVRLDREPDHNLLYGAGIHVCPGAPLARMEMRIVMEELLKGTELITAMPNKPPARATYPASGFDTCHVQIS